MSADLKPGDRALVVAGRLCCGNGSRVGEIFTIEKIELSVLICEDCSRRYITTAADFVGQDHSCALSRLIRIPPDSEMKTLFRETSKPLERA